MQLVHSGHGVYFAEYHICWCTKYRRRILNPGVSAYFRKTLAKITGSMPGVEIKEVGIDEQMKDHIHLVMTIPPRYKASAVVARLKSQTAGILRQKFNWLGKVYWEENIVWSPGFFLSTVGVDTEVIKQYVRWQGRQDSGHAQLNLLDSASV